MLKVFEAFAGYGSQRMALKNIGINHNIVGISEIDKDAILSYASIHTDFLKEKTQYISILKEDMISELENINVPLDYKSFKNKAEKMKLQQLQEFYLANKLTKNFGDITYIDPTILPDFDFFTYSFPCQDISVAGYQNGLNNNSGTRSSLLWECCKIIEYKRPKYLMMENVKNLIGKNHIHNFNLFLEYLASLGYINSWKVLNARNYGVPQSRERVFCISVLNSSNPFEFPDPVPLTTTMHDLLETDVDNKYYLKGDQTTDFIIQQDVCYCLDANYWKGTFLKDFLSKKRRQVVTGKQLSNGKYLARRLTPYETWKFMGCSEIDFKKAQQVVSNTALYRQAGNSIVVPVLEAIFEKLFK